MTPPKTANNPLSPVLDSSEGDSLETAALGVAAKPAPSPPGLSLEEIGCDLRTENAPQEKQEVCQPRKAFPVRGRVFVPETNGKKTKTVERTRPSAVLEKENRISVKQKVFSKPSSGDGEVARKMPPVPSSASRQPSTPAAKTTKRAKALSKEKPVAKPSLPGGGPRRVPINSADAPPMGRVGRAK